MASNTSREVDETTLWEVREAVRKLGELLDRLCADADTSPSDDGAPVTRTPALRGHEEEFWSSPSADVIADAAAEYGIRIRSETDDARILKVEAARRDNSYPKVTVEAFGALVALPPATARDTMRMVSTYKHNEGAFIRGVSAFFETRAGKITEETCLKAAIAAALKEVGGENEVNSHQKFTSSITRLYKDEVRKRVG